MVILKAMVSQVIKSTLGLRFSEVNFSKFEARMDACSKYNPKFCFGVFQVSCKIHPNPADRVEPFVRLVRLVLVSEALPKKD